MKYTTSLVITGLIMSVVSNAAPLPLDDSVQRGSPSDEPTPLVPEANAHKNPSALSKRAWSTGGILAGLVTAGGLGWLLGSSNERTKANKQDLQRQWTEKIKQDLVTQQKEQQAKWEDEVKKNQEAMEQQAQAEQNQKVDQTVRYYNQVERYRNRNGAATRRSLDEDLIGGTSTDSVPNSLGENGQRAYVDFAATATTG